MTDKEKLSVIKDYLKRLITLPCPDLTWFKAKEQAYKQVLEFIDSIDEQENKYKVGDLIQKNDGGVYKVVEIQPSYYTLECANGRREAYWVHEIDNFFTLYKVDVDCTIAKGSVKGVPMTAEKKLELIRNEIERCITIFGDCEAKCTTCTNDNWSEDDEKMYKSALWHISNSTTNGKSQESETEVTNWLRHIKERLSEHRVDKCTTCTNDKGCVTCENGEQWEGKAVDNTKSDNSQKNIECDLEDDYSDFMGLNRGAFCHQYKGDCEHCPYSSIKKTEGKPIERTDDELEESPDTDLYTSNEQKAIELCRKNYKNCNEMLCVGCPRQDFLATLIQMADFKDEQFKEELDHAYHCADHVQYMNGWRDAIEKAEDWLYDLKKH